MALTDRSEYINQTAIDAVAEQVKAISPDLEIHSISSRYGEASALHIEIFEKGNKELINKLCEIGFRIANRRKHDVLRSCGGTQYGGYSMLVSLTKYLD